MTCEICQGSRFIRLPRRKPMSVIRDVGSAIAPAAETSTLFPCPECGEDCPSNKLRIFNFEETVSGAKYIPQDQIYQVIGERAARCLVDSMLREGLIEIVASHKHDDQFPYEMKYRVTCAVMSPKHIKTYQDRINERQEEIASRVVEEACKRIYNFGSAYGWKDITKEEAGMSVREALPAVLEKAKKDGL